MAERSYGQFCGLARALDLVGERWALLIVRDLLVGPKRFTDLRRGLPRIPTNILTTRLKELEQTGIIERRLLPRPAGAIVYDLTEYGRDLEDVVLRLGRWGARSLGFPRPGEIVTPDSMVVALRAMFRPEAAAGVSASFELRLGPTVLHAVVADEKCTANVGPAPKPRSGRRGGAGHPGPVRRRARARAGARLGRGRHRRGSRPARHVRHDLPAGSVARPRGGREPLG